MRKIDYYGQVTLLLLIVLTALGYFVSKSSVFFSLIGLFILGIWQIISALSISFFHHPKINHKHIRNYWMACISTLLIFCGIFLFTAYNFQRLTNWLFGISVVFGCITACYYLYIYKKFFLQTANPESSKQDKDGVDLLPYV